MLPSMRLFLLISAVGLCPQASGARILKRRRHRAVASAAAESNYSDFSVSYSLFEGAGPLGRIPAGATTCGGRLYVFGGETDYRPDPWTVNRYLGDLWMFEPSGRGSAAAGKWKQLSSDGPSTRVQGSLVCADSVLTLFGGIHKTAAGDFVTVGDVWSFDLAAKTWTMVMEDSAAAGGPGPLNSHTAVLTDLDQDSMAVYGGNDPSFASRGDVWIYSLSKQTWRRASPPYSPAARHFHTAVAIPGTAAFRIWGGARDNTVWEYDLAGDSWSHAGFAPDYASGRMGAHWQGRLWSFGGMKLQGLQPMYLNELRFQSEYNNAFELASVVGPVPEGRCYAALTAIDGSLWIYGGYRRPADPERLATLWKATIA